MQLTTTEKLLVAMAYGLYGEDKLEHINTYLRCNGVEMDPSAISETHNKLKEESKMNGYSSILAYCEDRRYLKAIELFKMYKGKLWGILEEDLDPQDYSLSSSEEEWDVGGDSYKGVVKKTKRKETEVVLGTLDGIESLKFQNENQLQIEPKTINRSIGRSVKIETSLSLKERKRFYWKLTEEEKLIDDYFDILDERGDLRVDTPLDQENPFYKAFPPVDDIKRENKDNSSLEISDEKIKNRFDLIINKISRVRKQDKDKSLWRMEIRVLLEYIMTVIGHKKDFLEIYNKVEANSLSQVIILILLELQDIIIKNEDPELISTSGVLKKYVAAFYDYYRR